MLKEILEVRDGFDEGSMITPKNDYEVQLYKDINLNVKYKPITLKKGDELEVQTKTPRESIVKFNDKFFMIFKEDYSQFKEL